MEYAKSVKDYIESQVHRSEELIKLRSILLKTNLIETIKWGMPTYTAGGKNVVGIGSFKDWSCLWFHNGALLADNKGYLMNAQEGKTKALRQWRFSNIDEIIEEEIMPYVQEAIDNVEKGLSVIFKEKNKIIKIELDSCQSLLSALNCDEVLKTSFEELTLAQQRDYIEYIKEPKRESTRKTRLEKILPLISTGKPIAALWKK
jgi:uncharacterized protein YdeI (YjbR/CyaY-like superfamily)